MFPFQVQSNLFDNVPDITHRSVSLTIHSGLTFLVGPNGSGKTRILKGLKDRLPIQGRKTRFLSAGRIGLLEQYRSNHDGRGHDSQWAYINQQANFGDRASLGQRHSMESINGDFLTLSARLDIQIKVAERLRKLFRRDLVMEWDAGYLKPKFTDLEANLSYPTFTEASGLLHLTSILAALYDDEVGALLLDEPEVSLHPQLQSFLLREIQKVAGNPDEPGKKLVLVATHSTEMIEVQKPSDLPNIVFCYSVYKDPVQISPEAGELRGKKVKELLARLGQEHKLAFFCKRPVLIEGPSDQIICSGLDRKLELYMEAAGAQFLPVIGKGQMPVVAKLMRMIGKTPIILADADALADGLDLVAVFANEPSVRKAANEQGHTDAMSFAKSVYGEFCSLAENSWQDIESEAVTHPYWLNRDLGKDENVVKRRAAFATLISLDEAKVQSLNNAERWVATRLRLMALLDFLEAAGCFILRKGSIESYYQFVDKYTSDGKPSAAVEEIMEIAEQSEVFINERYDDVLRCLKYAANAEVIDETRALKEMVLAIASPALAELENKNDADLQALARRLLNDGASLFKLSKHQNRGVAELVVDMESKVLDVGCFPIRLRVNDNPITEVAKQMNLA